VDPVDPDPDPDSQRCDYQVIQIYDRRMVPLCQAGRSSPVSNSGSDSAPPPELYSTSIHTPRYSSVYSAGNFKQSMGARNRVGIGLSYRPARLHSLAELVPWDRFLGSLKVKKFGLCILCLHD
jgi:hypothetical protein